ncbi:HlyD family efflux transporter periplasmic adaptor subunit [Marinobacter hydrocarbonoclasticus]|nr:HlyD family efflux transporter periplasmic adaptor subunit [Marinobacter nauticus]
MPAPKTPQVEPPQRLLGAVTLAQPLSLHLAALSLFALVAITLLFLANAHYARKETVVGYLKPVPGLVKVMTGRLGTVEALMVEEGEAVEKGQVLATMVHRRGTAVGTPLSDRLLTELNEQLSMVERQLAFRQTLYVAENQRLMQQVADLNLTTETLSRQHRLAQQEVALFQQRMNQYRRLLEQGHLSILEFQSHQAESLAKAQSLAALEASLAQSKSEHNQASARRKSMAAQHDLDMLELERERSQLEAQRAEVETQYRYVVRASVSGTVTAIAVTAGEFIAGQRPLMSLIPKGATLNAELLLPSRSAGFVRQGDVARLRFDAFPYQRFGIMEARVFQVDQALLQQGDADLPLPLTEPVYRVRARLAHQAVQAEDQTFALRPGMKLEADIILDQRSILDWLLEPIYGLKGRW